jgi:DoxX-like family
MKQKTINTLYWIFTILFSALMLFSSWSSIMVNEDAIKIIHGMLGYPQYFIPFTGWAKLMGVLVILIPGFGRIKEWAYAGLFFDLVAAVYSGIAVSKTFDPAMLTLLIWLVPGILSYVYYHKKMKGAPIKKMVPENKKEAVLSY